MTYTQRVAPCESSERDKSHPVKLPHLPSVSPPTKRATHKVLWSGVAMSTKLGILVKLALSAEWALNLAWVCSTRKWARAQNCKVEKAAHKGFRGREQGRDG